MNEKKTIFEHYDFLMEITGDGAVVVVVVVYTLQKYAGLFVIGEYNSLC